MKDKRELTEEVLSLTETLSLRFSAGPEDRTGHLREDPAVSLFSGKSAEIIFRGNCVGEAAVRTGEDGKITVSDIRKQTLPDEITLPVEVLFGTTTIQTSVVGSIPAGTDVPLESVNSAGALDLYVNGKVCGWGEAVAVGDLFGVRIMEINSDGKVQAQKKFYPEQPSSHIALRLGSGSITIKKMGQWDEGSIVVLDTCISESFSLIVNGKDAGPAHLSL